MIRIGVAQTQPTLGDTEKNVSELQHVLGEATSLGIDVLVLPELANSGYTFNSLEEASSSSEEIPSGDFCRVLQSWSTENRLVVSGICERTTEGLFNSAAVFAQGKYVTTYRKIHLFNQEKQWFKQGESEPPIVEFRSNRYGIMICWDWAFPEVARILALKGAQVILHPANLVLQYCQGAMQTRSVENGIFTVTANRIGIERDLSFSGKSQITDTRGNLLLSMSSDITEVKYIDLDPSKADDKMMTPLNHLLNDRRPEMYSILTTRF